MKGGFNGPRAPIILATNVRGVNLQVEQEAAQRGILCNVADNPTAGTFHVPAVHRDENLVVTVSTNGRSPQRASVLRDRIAAWLAESGEA